VKAEAVLNQLEDDELSIQNDEELKAQFERVKTQLGWMPLYDKEISLRM
jgi:hypothetical protein